MLLALVFVVPNINRTQLGKQANNSETSDQTKAPDNEEAFREAFIANCVLQAQVNIGKTAADAYCSCVLDRGIEVHGTEGFVAINQRFAKTYDMSELKDIIDGCTAKAVGN